LLPLYALPPGHDIDGVDKRLIFDWRFDNLSAAANAGVVNEAIQACTLLPDHFDNSINLILLGHVESHGRNVFDRIKCGEILVLTRAGVDVIAILSQRFGEISADARTCARYQDRLVIVCKDGVRRRKKNDCDGNDKPEKLLHRVSLLFLIAVTLAHTELIEIVRYGRRRQPSLDTSVKLAVILNDAATVPCR